MAAYGKTLAGAPTNRGHQAATPLDMDVIGEQVLDVDVTGAHVLDLVARMPRNGNGHGHGDAAMPTRTCSG